MFRRRGKSIDDAEKANSRLTSLENAVGNLQHRMATHEFRFRDVVNKQSALERRLDRELQRRRISDETSPPVASHRGARAFAMPPLQQSAMFDFDDLETLEHMPTSTKHSIIFALTHGTTRFRRGTHAVSQRRLASAAACTGPSCPRSGPTAYAVPRFDETRHFGYFVKFRHRYEARYPGGKRRNE